MPAGARSHRAVDNRGCDQLEAAAGDLVALELFESELDDEDDELELEDSDELDELDSELFGLLSTVLFDDSRLSVR